MLVQGLCIYVGLRDCLSYGVFWGAWLSFARVVNISVFVRDYLLGKARLDRVERDRARLPNEQNFFETR